jgi:hypothetical protein
MDEGVRHGADDALIVRSDFVGWAERSEAHARYYVGTALRAFAHPTKYNAEVTAPRVLS